MKQNEQAFEDILRLDHFLHETKWASLLISVLIATKY